MTKKYFSMWSLIVCLMVVMLCTNCSSLNEDARNQFKIDRKSYRNSNNNMLEILPRTRMIHSQNFREIKEYEEDDISPKLYKTIEFIEHPVDTLLTGSFPVRIQCLVKNAYQVLMECNGILRDDSSRNISKNESLESLSILIRRSEIEDTPMSCYCIAISEDRKEKIYSDRAQIQKSFLDNYFLTEPMDEISYEGDTVELRCDPPKGEPSPTVYWLKDNVKINTRSDSSRVKISNDFSLLILYAKKQDVGDYICVATNQVEIQLSKSAKLVLLDMTEKYSWSEWSDWSRCPRKCGKKHPNIKKRYRYCQTKNKMSQLEKVEISKCGDNKSFEEESCSDLKCEYPEWSNWSQWSLCSIDCKQYRRRYCDGINKQEINSRKQNGCQGKNFMSRDCGISQCKSDEFNYAISNQAAKEHDKEIRIGSVHEENTLLGLNLSKTTLSLSLGIISILVLLLIFTCMLLGYMNRRRNKNFTKKRNNKNGFKKNSELNLYYTCEGNNQIGDDECSLFKFTRCGPNNHNIQDNSLSSDNSGRFYNNEHLKGTHRSGPRLYENNLFGKKNNENNTLGIEKQLLLKQQFIKQQVINPNTNSFNNINQFRQNSNPNSPFKPFKNNKNNTSNTSTSSSSHSTNTQNNHTPTTSCMTKTSTMSSSPTSTSSAYYDQPRGCLLLQQNLIQSPIRSEKIIVLKNNNNDNTHLGNYANVNLKEEINEQIYETTDQLDSFIDNNSKNSNFIKLNSEAYINSSELKDYNLKSNDLCVGRIGSNGAKLSLDCGVSLIIPEGAIASNQQIIMYLGICRSDSYKPKMTQNNDKSSLLTETLLVGPLNTLLFKPCVLIIEQCAKNIEEDWSVSLFSNTINSDHFYKQEKIDEIDNNKVFVNPIDSNFVLMIEKLGRFVLTGQPIFIKNKDKKTEKYFRLVTFISSSITNNDFNMRIYCVDNLLNALQDILNDEKQIGGILLEASEVFGISYNSNDSLSIRLDELKPDKLCCKYNINVQEIPISHIWNRKNHLLHCSFSFDLKDTFCKDLFKCKINVNRTNNGVKSKSIIYPLNVCVNIEFDLKNLIGSNSNSNDLTKMKLIKLDHSWKWNKASQHIYSQNSIRNSYKMDNIYKSQICNILDKSCDYECNWRVLARYLGIKYLNYFALKTSPTQTLLIYLEALSELYIQNNDPNNQSVIRKESCLPGLCLPLTQNFDSIFQSTYNFLDKIKTNLEQN